MGGIAIYYRSSYATSIEHLTKHSNAFICSIKIRPSIPTDPPTVITAVYCPTTNHQELSTDFFNQLNDLTSSLPPNTIHVTLGDFNSHIGSFSGDKLPNGMPRNNTNGNRLLDHCYLHNLLNLNTAFKHTFGVPTMINRKPPYGSSIIDFALLPHQHSDIVSHFKLTNQFLSLVAHNV